MQGNLLIDYWAFHLSNYLLAIVMYMLIGRLILSFFFQPTAENVLWRAFVRLTDPAVSVVGFITPRAVPLPILLIFAALWVLVIRQAMKVILTLYGLAPTLG